MVTSFFTRLIRNIINEARRFVKKIGTKEFFPPTSALCPKGGARGGARGHRNSEPVPPRIYPVGMGKSLKEKPIIQIFCTFFFRFFLSIAKSFKGGGRSVLQRATPPPLNPPAPARRFVCRARGEVLGKYKPRDYRVVFYVQKSQRPKPLAHFCFICRFHYALASCLCIKLNQ